jgi:hypothetical protein
MSVHLLESKDESAARSDHPRLRATATVFVPNSDKIYSLCIDEKLDPLSPLVVESPPFSSVKNWIEKQSHYDVPPPQPLTYTVTSRKKYSTSRRASRRQHQRSQSSQHFQAPTDWHYPPLHQPSRGARNGAVLPFYQEYDAPLYGFTTPILQAAEPFHDQVDKINEQLVLFIRSDRESGTCQSVYYTA